MSSTPASLLDRLKQAADETAWTRFVDLYTPLLFYWAKRLGLQPSDAADLVQDVLAVLVRKLSEFNYDRHQSFRGWLRTVTLNKWRDHRRRPELPAEPDPVEPAGPDTVAAFWEADYRRHLVSRALELMRTEFQPATWRACWETVVQGRSAAEVGTELGLSPGAVYVAKCRVLSRLRQELTGLLE